jgi:hypothetical protein
MKKFLILAMTFCLYGAAMANNHINFKLTPINSDKNNSVLSSDPVVFGPCVVTVKVFGSAMIQGCNGGSFSSFSASCTGSSDANCELAFISAQNCANTNLNDQINKAKVAAKKDCIGDAE